MSQLSLYDYLAITLRLRRPPAGGVPTLAEVWWEEGPDHGRPPAAADPAPRSNDAPPRRRRLARGDGPLPLAVAGALSLAWAGQAILTGGRPAVAAVLLAGAVGAAFFAIRRGEVAVEPAAGSGPDTADADPPPRPVLLAAAAAAAAVTAVGAHDNRAGFGVAVVWLVAVGLVVAGLTTRPGDGRRLAERLGDTLRRPGARLGLRSGVLALVAVVVVGAAVRVDDLGSIPAEMTSIHAELLQAVIDGGHGDSTIVAPSSTGGFDPIPVVVDAWLMPLVGGISFAGLKLGTVLAGLAALPFIYLLGCELGGRGVGLAAAALAAVGQWPDLASRLGFTAGWIVPFAAAALLFVLRGVRRGRRADLVAAGVVVGLGLQTHPIGRAVAATAVALVAVAAVSGRFADRRRLAAGLAALLAVAAVTGLPTLVATPDPQPESGPLWWLGAATGERGATVADGLAERAGRVLMLPLLSDGPAWFHGGTGRPALDRAAGSLLVLGAALALAAAVLGGRGDGLLVLAAVPLLMLPAIVAPIPPELAPSPLRCAGAVAPIFVLAGIGLAALVRALSGLAAGAAGRRLGIAVAVLVIAWSAAAGRRTVRGPFAESWDRSTWNASELAEVMRGAAAVGIPPERASVVAHPHWVDTRLVAVWAGRPGDDVAVDPDAIIDRARRGGPQLYLVHPDDRKTLMLLERVRPDATTTRHPSRVPGKSFVSVMVPAATTGND